jgi:ATP-binding cassette subfamily B protein
MKHFIKVKQHDITDCGAACLASVAAHYNLKLPIVIIRQLASTDRHGTNILGMIEAAESLGFSAKGVKGPFQCLFEIPKPAIVHVIVKEMLHHYMVLYKIDKRSVILMDPSDGKLHKKNHKDFQKEWTGIILLLVPSEKFQSGGNNQSIGRRFISLIKPYKTVMLQSLFGALIYALLGLTTSIYVQKIIDNVLVDGNLNLLNLMSVVMIILLFLKIYINIMKSIFALKTGQRIDAMLIMGYYRHLLELPQRFFDTMRIGEIISRINDAIKIRVFINNVSLDLVVYLMIVIFTCGLMLVFSWKMAMVILLGIPFYMAIYFIFNLINKKVLRRIMENSADLEAHLVESLNSISTIKQFSANWHANIKTESRFYKLLKSVYISSKSSILTHNATELTAGILTVAILWCGSDMVLNSEITPGTLLSFYALLGYLIGPVTYLINANQNIQDAVIAADRLFQIMDLECEDSGEEKININKESIGDICFNNVAFCYGTRLQVFENLNLTLKRGEISAVMGESGSGKTSIIAMLEKLYEIQSGSIEIGKYNIKHINTLSLRNNIGIVPQRIELISGTITENIAFGEFEPDLKRIIDICTMLQIREFIEKIPGAYNAYLGEHGVSLSGGEQQRLAIARALYRDPQILIFDEATSSLDTAAESHIWQVICQLKRQDKTIVIITHRINTIMHADRIFVLHKGSMVEEGEHAELLAKRGKYYHLWKQQFPFIEDINC